MGLVWRKSYKKWKKKPSPKPHSKKSLPTYNDQRRNLLSSVIDSQLTSSPLPELFKKIRSNLKKEVEQKNDILEWAKDCPEYHDLYKRKEVKRQKKYSNKGSIVSKPNTLLSAKIPCSSCGKEFASERISDHFRNCKPHRSWWC